MKLTEYAWATAQSLTQKYPSEIKLLVDDIDYPRLESDAQGYVLRIASPRRVAEDFLRLHGMDFANDMEGRVSLWRSFRASIHHLCMHSILTDFGVYRGLPTDAPRLNNTMFAISLSEDYAIRGYLRARWPVLLNDAAHANQLGALALRDVSLETNVATKLAANLLLYSMTGKPAVKIDYNLDRKTSALHLDLLKLESSVFDYFSELEESLQLSKTKDPALDAMKVEQARRVFDLFDEYNAELPSIPSVPYTDSYGPNTLFNRSTKGFASQRYSATLRDALRELRVEIQTSEQLFEEGKSLQQETQDVLGEWEFDIARKDRALSAYRAIDKKTHFEHFLYPSEDYAEFVRTRSRLIGTIARVIEQLWMVNYTFDEVPKKESGFVDSQEAIQVVASRSSRNDVFLRDELVKKSVAWAIVIDSSKSLESAQGEVRSVAVCLAEVAKELIRNPNSWACYSFNENMYIVKDFTEQYGRTVKGRIGSLSTGVKTFLPDALRIAAHRLASSTEEVKILLVASDGYPLGYEGIDKELIRTVDEINRSGIMLVGLGVGGSSIEKYFRSSCEINTPFDLMKSFVKVYFEIASLF